MAGSPDGDGGTPAPCDDEPMPIVRRAIRRFHDAHSGRRDAGRGPKIGIVGSAAGLAICYAHVDEIARHAATGIESAGGVPVVLHTGAPCDGLFSANGEKGRLAGVMQRIADDVAMMAHGGRLDGLLFLSSCDTTNPAHLLAAVRSGLPSVVLACGYQAPGEHDGRRIDLLDVYEGVGKVSTGQMPFERLASMAERAAGGPGVCPGLGTATTMHMLVEVLGIALPGLAPVSGSDARLREAARRAGGAACEAVRVALTPQRVLTPEAFEDAIELLLAIGGAPSCVGFLQTVVDALGWRLDLRACVGRIAGGGHCEQLVHVAPCGDTPVTTLDEAGGAAQVMKRIAGRLHPQRPSVAGGTLGDALAAIGQRDHPLFNQPPPHGRAEPGLLLLHGSLAEGGALVRPAAVPAGMRRFSGRASVMRDSAQAYEALRGGRIAPGTVVVIQGGSIDDFACAVAGTGLHDKIAMISDMGYSALSRGLCVGFIRPSVSDGGPIARLRDGDSITIDLDRRRIDAGSA